MVLKEIQIDKIKNFNNNSAILDPDRIEYWKEKRIVPPIIVRSISNGYYWLKDGSHRIAAYLELNKKNISAKVM